MFPVSFTVIVGVVMSVILVVSLVIDFVSHGNKTIKVMRGGGTFRGLID